METESLDARLFMMQNILNRLCIATGVPLPVVTAGILPPTVAVQPAAVGEITVPASERRSRRIDLT